MRSVHPEKRPWRTRAQFALNCPAAASGQISAIFHANSARAARLNEPVAPLSGLLQTGGCNPKRPALSWARARISTAVALDCGHCSGRWALRVLAPSAFADAAMPRNFSKRVGSAARSVPPRAFLWSGCGGMEPAISPPPTSRPESSETHSGPP